MSHRLGVLISLAIGLWACGGPKNPPPPAPAEVPLGEVLVFSPAPEVAAWGQRLSPERSSDEEVGKRVLIVGEPPLIQARVGLVMALGGPQGLTLPASDPHLKAALALTRGATALRAGLYPQAVAALEAAPLPDPEWEAWRQALLVMAKARTVVDEAEGQAAVALPADAPETLRWAAAMAAAFGPNRDRASLFAAEWTGPRAALVASLSVLWAETDACQAMAPLERSEALAKTADALAKAGLPELAALAQASRVPLLGRAPVAVREALTATLTLARAPEAAWLREEIARTALFPLTTDAGLDTSVKAEADALAALWLTTLKAQVQADPGPGAAAKRRVAALSGLIDGLASRQPALLQEVMDAGLAGDQSATATLVMVLATQGGLLKLMSPNGLAQLNQTLAFAELALAKLPVSEHPSPDEQVARALIEGLLAASRFMQGDVATAEQALLKADARLPAAEVLAARAAALKSADPEAAAAYGPWVKLGILAARAVLGGLTGDQAKLNQALTEAQTFGRDFARAELVREGVEAELGQHVDSVFELLAATIALLKTQDDATFTAARQAAGRLKMDVPPAGKAQELGRWFVLAGLLIRDATWLLDVSERGAKADRALLEGTEPAMAALLKSWPATAQSGEGLGLGRGLLLAVSALQAGLPQAPRLMALAKQDPALLLKEPWLRETGLRVAQAIQAEHPEAARRAALLADRPSALILDHLLTLMAAPKLDGPTLLAVLEGRNQDLFETLPGHSTVKAVLALELVALNARAGRLEHALTWTARGKDAAEGTRLASKSYLWPMIRVWVARLKGDEPARLLAHAEAVMLCPGLAAQLDSARALDLADRPQEAYALLNHARAEARRRGQGTPSLSLVVNGREGHSAMTATQTFELRSLLAGKPAGTFQVGAGANAEQATLSELYVGISADDGPEEVAADTLILEGLIALYAGDEAHVDQVLSLLSTLLANVDPRWTVENPVDGPALMARAPKVRLALEGVWLSLLAEQRGHRALAPWLLRQIFEQQASAITSASGVTEVCETPAPEGLPPVLAGLNCAAPKQLAGLLTPEGGRALAEWAVLRMRQLSGETVAEPVMLKAVMAANRAAPRLMNDAAVALAKGKPTAGVEAALKAFGGDGASFDAAVAAGFACQAALTAVENGTVAPAKALGVMGGCGAVPFRLQALVALINQGAPLPVVQEAIIQAATQPTLTERAMPLIWAGAQRLALANAADAEALLAAAKEVGWQPALAPMGAICVAHQLVLAPSDSQQARAAALLALIGEASPEDPAIVFLKQVNEAPAKADAAAFLSAQRAALQSP